MAVPMSSTVNHGGSATFTCSAEGGPDNVFRWLYNGTERLCSSNCTTDNTSIDINGKDYNYTLYVSSIILYI